MVRGWRNDPAWVAHYAKRDLERAQRAIDRAHLALEMQRNTEKIERAIRSLKRKPLSIVYDYSI